MIKHILTALLLATGINVLNANANVNVNPDVNPDANDSVITNIVGSINAVSGTVDSLTQDSIRTERAESKEEAEKIEEAESKEKAESIEKANADFAARQQRLSYLRQVYDKAVYVQNISSKISLGIQGMGKDVTLDGKLQMRKGQVIRLTIVPFGLMEVARLEFTPTYVLLIDRIHKEYVKASYNEVEFLKTEGLTFYTLQSLFWNELFQPGKARLAEGDLSLYTTDDLSNGGKKINFQHENMSFSWINRQSCLHQGNGHKLRCWHQDGIKRQGLLRQLHPRGCKEFPQTGAHNIQHQGILHWHHVAQYQHGQHLHRRQLGGYHQRFWQLQTNLCRGVFLKTQQLLIPHPLHTRKKHITKN